MHSLPPCLVAFHPISSTPTHVRPHLVQLHLPPPCSLRDLPLYPKPPPHLTHSPLFLFLWPFRGPSSLLTPFSLSELLSPSCIVQGHEGERHASYEAQLGNQSLEQCNGGGLCGG
ncbi:hypothetical protein FA13DRAFT_284427 [Coprinellus micaceus]|uniref:Uncharacterized protein n=1 Tax=Coprinellus micaceus TaxID=71717 RepID=A0A4Y7TDM3_COPMI|nr:hypothetical protein FA13DRAFT_284427 [Coprinellus micaceus]